MLVFPTSLAGEHEGLKAATLHGAGPLTDSLLANLEKAAATVDAWHGGCGEGQQQLSVWEGQH